MNKRLKINILFFAVILTLTACTPGATQGQQTQKGQVNVDQQKKQSVRASLDRF